MQSLGIFQPPQGKDKHRLLVVTGQLLQAVTTAIFPLDALATTSPLSGLGLPHCHVPSQGQMRQSVENHHSFLPSSRQIAAPRKAGRERAAWPYGAVPYGATALVTRLIQVQGAFEHQTRICGEGIAPLNKRQTSDVPCVTWDLGCSAYRFF